MAVARVQVSTSLVDREEAFIKSITDGTALLQSKGLRNMLRLSHSGTAGIEVWSVTLFEDWKDYGRAMDMFSSDAELQAFYMDSVVNRTGQLIESFEMTEVPGFERGVDPSGEIIAGTAWRVNSEQGSNGQFLKSCAAAKEIHEKHGARVRLWQAIGGRYGNCALYTCGLDSFTAFGEWQENSCGDFAEFFRQQPVSAAIEGQLILRPAG